MSEFVCCVLLLSSAFEFVFVRGSYIVHLTGFSCAARVGTLLQSFYRRRRRQAKYFTTRYVAISSECERERADLITTTQQTDAT